LKASSKFLHVSLLKLNDEKEGKIHLKPITSLSKGEKLRLDTIVLNEQKKQFIFLRLP